MNEEFLTRATAALRRALAEGKPASVVIAYADDASLFAEIIGGEGNAPQRLAHLARTVLENAQDHLEASDEPTVAEEVLADEIADALSMLPDPLADTPEAAA